MKVKIPLSSSPSQNFHHLFPHIQGNLTNTHAHHHASIIDHPPRYRSGASRKIPKQHMYTSWIL
ncbi:hypothetical protein COCSADRAFT_287123 [Bipolaris sorokiniana ND90Pr]|uniref:Uncharacterized protein n=1 Tax=Cochliobolus sativus (strain ND90Pr / ATCC 201652) TaxID=665912 RepID=M2RKI4_COCSN|nr:uncharacterized protein COCSADRAFT_287123 [Bipolaris sorokiniana ND90Pr]EMD67189.1 hypothetical protein COCSADRAFT_287123 [Bipolaris sorokiniana ND90Pr]